MPAPTTTWYCDSCGGLIEQADRGWVEWIKLPKTELTPHRGRDIRIVHHVTPNGCQFDSRQEYAKDGGTVSDDPLPQFQGPDGLIRLLEMVEEQCLPTPELLEIIKRIHIPGYEHARRHFDRALAAGVIVENVTSGYWRQADLQHVLDFAADEQRSRRTR